MGEHGQAAERLLPKALRDGAYKVIAKANVLLHGALTIFDVKKWGVAVPFHHFTMF